MNLEPDERHDAESVLGAAANILAVSPLPSFWNLWTASKTHVFGSISGEPATLAPLCETTSTKITGFGVAGGLNTIAPAETQQPGAINLAGGDVNTDPASILRPARLHVVELNGSKVNVATSVNPTTATTTT